MDWAVLPLGGGIYDQHPKLIDQWQIIFEERRKHREEQDSPDKKLGNKKLHVPKRFQP